MMRLCQKCLARPAALPLVCYLLAAVCWLASGVCGALEDRSLTALAVPMDAVELVNMAPREAGGYITLNDDPQMIWENAGGQQIRTVSYTLTEKTGDLREICLYYNTAPGQPFDQRRRIFPRRVGERYVFTLPHTRIAALRLDPCSPGDGAVLELRFAADTIEINDPAVLPHGLEFFRPEWYELFELVLYPALAAAALDWLRAVWRWLHKR